MMKQSYILITPAHNEDAFIEQLIECIVNQTIRPVRWIIVDDASSDQTGDIIRSYCERYNFIQYYYIEPKELVTYYSRRTHVFLKGYEQIKDKEYEFVGALDADITLPPDYYENILMEFKKNPQLGIATGVYVENINGILAPLVHRYHDSTPGGLQLFRRQCYDDIGGYLPLDYGGDDTLAGIMARMNDWETTCFSEYVAIHHRPVGQKGKGALRAKFQQGMTDCQLGSHILFMLAKWARRILLERPYFLSSTARLIGYLSGFVMIRKKSKVPNKAASFYRHEQLSRLFLLRSAKNKLTRRGQTY